MSRGGGTEPRGHQGGTPTSASTHRSARSPSSGPADGDAMTTDAPAGPAAGPDTGAATGGDSLRAGREATATNTHGSERRSKAMAWMRPHLRDLKPYYKPPVDGDPLRLDQNTNLNGTNPALAKVDAASLSVVDYPSRDGDDLMAALARWHGLRPENFLAANGSDETLDIITKTFAGPGDALATPAPSYSLYPFYAKLQHLRFLQIPTRGGFNVDVDALLDAKAKITLVANPNNPTGRRVRRGDLEQLITRSNGIVVVDEAYIEYAGLRYSLASRVEEFENLVVMRTFSKAYGLAGLRIGYLVTNTDLMERMRLVKPPFNLNTYCERVACAALEEQEWVDQGVATVRRERERLDAGLRRLGFETTPSEANFILARSPLPPGEVADGLRKRGILVRHFPGAPMLDDHVRFSVGEPQHTDQLLAAMAEVMA